MFPEFISVQMINLIITLNLKAICSLLASCVSAFPSPGLYVSQGGLSVMLTPSPLSHIHSPSTPFFNFYCLKMNAPKKYTPKLVTVPGFGFSSSKSPLAVQTKLEENKKQSTNK